MALQKEGLVQEKKGPLFCVSSFFIPKYRISKKMGLGLLLSICVQNIYFCPKTAVIFKNDDDDDDVLFMLSNIIKYMQCTFSKA